MTEHYNAHPHGKIVLEILKDAISEFVDAHRIYDMTGFHIGAEHLEKGLDAHSIVGYKNHGFLSLILETKTTSLGLNNEQFINAELPESGILPLPEVLEGVDVFAQLHDKELYPATDMPVSEVRDWLQQLLPKLEPYCVFTGWLIRPDAQHLSEEVRDLLALLFILKDDWEPERNTQRIVQLIWSGPQRLKTSLEFAKQHPDYKTDF